MEESPVEQDANAPVAGLSGIAQDAALARSNSVAQVLGEEFSAVFEGTFHVVEEADLGHQGSQVAAGNVVTRAGVDEGYDDLAVVCLGADLEGVADLFDLAGAPTGVVMARSSGQPVPAHLG